MFGLRRNSLITAGLLLTLACPSMAALTWGAPEVVDSANAVGQYASIALDTNEFPHIAYYDATAGDLKHAFRDSTGWHMEIVESAGDVGKFASIAVGKDAVCHITYKDVTTGKLKYARGSFENWQTTAVDSLASTGYNSLALDGNGMPRVVYMATDAGALRYAAWNGTSWSIETIDPGPNVGRYCSLAMDSQDRPHVSYQEFLNFNLKYALRTDSGWQTQVVESQNSVGSYSSIVLDTTGQPHIAHCDATNLDLRYTRFDGQKWYPQAVDTPGNVGRFCRLAMLPNGQPCVSYFDYANRDLKFAYLDTWGWHALSLDGPSDVGWYTACAADPAGSVSIAYYDDTNGDLKYLRGAAGVDTTPPSRPTVTDDGTYTASASELHASWTSSDLETGVAKFIYAVGTSPGLCDLVSWSTPTSATELFLRELPLQADAVYYFSVKACNGAGLWSEEGYSDGIRVVRRIGSPGQARHLTDGSWVFLANQVVSAGTEMFDTFLYAQDPERSSGIRINPGIGQPTTTAGDVISVAGKLTTVGGERVLINTTITPVSHDLPPRELGMAGTATGLSTTGLLVRVWGKVTEIGGDYICIDDGSLFGALRIVCDPSGIYSDDYLVVTGVSSLFTTPSGRNARQILATSVALR